MDHVTLKHFNLAFLQSVGERPELHSWRTPALTSIGSGWLGGLFPISWDTREMRSHHSSLPFLDRRWSQPPSWLSCPVWVSSYSPSSLIPSQRLSTLIIGLPKALVLPPRGLSGVGRVVGRHHGQNRSEDTFRTSQCSDAPWPRGPKWNSSIACGNSERLR